MHLSTPAFKLQVIIFLDSLCYGLIYGFLSPYVISLGANNFVVGILSVGNLIGTLMSADLINNLAQLHGKQHSLFLVFNVALASHFLMIVSKSYWCTIFARYIFSITNQSQNLCKDLLLLNTRTDEREYFLTRFSILSAAGYIIGPFISGYLFSIGFLYDGLLTMALTAVNIYLITSFPRRRDDVSYQRNEKSFLKKSGEKVDESIQNFVKCDYKKDWDIMAIKFLYISSITIFFTKFTQILKVNFNSTPFMVGYTSSYMNSLTFAGTYFATNMKDRLGNYTTVLDCALVIAGIALLSACYASVYNIFAIMCIPIIFSTSFINSIWKDLFSMRRNSALEKTNIPLGILAGLTVPLIFGILCDIIGYRAVIIISVLPIIISLFILNKYTVQYKLLETGTENKKSKDE